MEGELINGFDEIMTHIKNQEERVRQLEEENRLLKSELDDIKKFLELKKLKEKIK